jgi:predicted Zn-dependent peptidase
MYRNTFYKAAAFAFILLSLVTVGFAQEGKLDSVAAQAAQVTEFDVNGLKVIVKRRASAPTVSGGLFIRGGARNITEKNAGIEDLMLDSAIEAGKNIPRQQVRRELSRLGSVITAAAGQDYSAVSFASTRQAFDRVWEVFSDVTLNPAFNEEDVRRNREQKLAALREAAISPEGAVQALQDKAVYSGHPYANDTSGSAATIAALTAEDLRAYHKSVMQTSRLLLVFVGDLDPNELKAKITATFGKLPRGDYKETPLPALDFSKPTLDVTSRSLPTNYVQGEFAAPSLGSPDYYAMRVATSILQSLVYQEVRIKRQLSYAPEARLNNLGANTGAIAVTSTDPNQAVSVMLDQIKLLRTRRLNEEVISEVAGSFLTNYYLGQETNAAQVGELARYELIGGGWKNSFEFLNRVREVTAADVQRVSNQYMKNLRFAVVGKPEAIDRSIFVAG